MNRLSNKVLTTTNNNEMAFKSDIIHECPKQDKRHTERLKRGPKRSNTHVGLLKLPKLRCMHCDNTAFSFMQIKYFIVKMMNVYCLSMLPIALIQ